MSELTLREAAKKPEAIAPGHRLCAGCDETLIARMVLKAMDPHRLRERRSKRERDRGRLEGDEA